MFDKQILKIKGSKWALAICAIFAFFSAFAILGQAISLSYAICGLWEGEDLSSVLLSVGIFAICFIVRELLSFFQESYIDSFARKSVLRLQEAFLSDAYDAGPNLVRKKGVPATTALLIDGSDDVAQYLRVLIPKLTQFAIIPIILLVALFCYDVISGFIAFIFFPFIFIFMRLIGMSAKEQANKRHAQFERLSNSFVNKAQGIVDLKSFGADDLFAKIIYGTSEAFRKITMKTLRVSMLSSAVLDLFSTLALAAVAIMLGFRMVEGTVEFFPALCVLVIVPEYFKPIKEFGSNYHETLDGKESLRAMFALMEDARDRTLRIPPFWADSLTDEGMMEIDTSKHRSLAITGCSGSGKTTLLNAIAGLTDPPEGFCFLVEGEPTNTMSDQDWRSRIAFIPQDPHIFNDSIRNNVRFYKPNATDDEVKSALDAVGMLDFVQGLDAGLDTLIGEGGRALSGGQLARISLSRAFVDQSRDILIMDEPSSHIDAETEEEIKQAIMPMMRERTSFVVTHSEAWANDMDERLVIENHRSTESAKEHDSL